MNRDDRARYTEKVITDGGYKDNFSATISENQFPALDAPVG
jgi:hypothetical protein